MMPGVVAGFPRRAATPGQYVIAAGVNAFGYSGYSGYAGDISDGPFGSATPARPNVSPNSIGGDLGSGELLAVYWSEGTLTIVVRGSHASAAQYPFTTLTVGGVTIAKSAGQSFASYGTYSALRFSLAQNPLPSGAQVQIGFT